MLIHWQKNFPFFPPFGDKNIEPFMDKRVLPQPTIPQINADQRGGLAGIAGRRRPAIPYQAFNLTQTTMFNPKAR
jgi:hypothetical protein